jgi:DNA replication licensing factor MCM7
VFGIYMPSQFSGFKALTAGLIHDTYIDAFKIAKDKLNFKSYMLSDQMMEKVRAVRQTESSEHDLFVKMANSICPEIFGMEEVKQALLLLMVGGVTKELNDGMRIRGHLNALLMGDPGVAKS